MASGLFQCSTHDFSTDDIISWDEHMADIEHEYDLHTGCSICGVPIHIKPKQKLALQFKRIPRGYLCSECIPKIKDTPLIKEAGEINA